MRGIQWTKVAYGRRGAEARERRILEHGDSPEARRRVQQQELSSAIALVHLVYGPPWRPRRVPHREEEMAPRLSEAIDVLQRALDAEQNATGCEPPGRCGTWGRASRPRRPPHAD